MAAPTTQPSSAPATSTEPPMIVWSLTGPTTAEWPTTTFKIPTTQEVLEPLPKPLQELAMERREAFITLLQGYKQIHEDALAGKDVTAEQIERVEKTFNEQYDAIAAKVKEEIPRQVELKLAERPPAAKPVSTNRLQAAWNGAVEFVNHLRDHKYYAGGMEREYEILSNRITRLHRLPDELADSLRDVWALEEAFGRKLISPDARPENTELTAGTQTAADLVSDLLSKNRGIAVGEMHTHAETLQFLRNNMALFKKSGVDTIYLESDKESLDEVKDMSIPELRQLEKDGYLGQVKLSTVEQQAKGYGVKYMDDMEKEFIGFLADAKEQGIRIVNIDKTGPIRDEEDYLSSTHRIDTTNFTWTKNIEADRKALAEQGAGGGKFIAYGGLAHFTATVSRIEEGSNGLVDEALGIPVIAFTQRDKNAVPEVQREFSPNGPDFYLPGGKEYPDTLKYVRARDLQDINDKLIPYAEIPGVGMVVDQIFEWSQKLRKEGEKELQMNPKDVPGPASNPDHTPQVQSPRGSGKTIP